MSILSQSNKSSIFTKYNQMRADGAEQGRLNRALGLAQATEKRPYNTTIDSCDCPDAKFRNNICKHILSVRMQQAVPAAVAVATERMGDAYIGVFQDASGKKERRVITRLEWLEIESRLVNEALFA